MTDESTNTKAVSAPAPGLPPGLIARSVEDPPATPFEVAGPGSLTLWLAQIADEFIPWGQDVRERDRQLREFWHTEPMLAGAIYQVIAQHSTFDWELEGPPRTTEAVQTILNEANLGKGWEDFITRGTTDLLTQDNGWWFEIIRTSDSPTAPVLGINHLDSNEVMRTGDPKTPAIYHDRKGRRHLLKWYQVVDIAEMRSPIRSMYGVQYCAVTRILRAAQVFRDLGIYKSEKIGGRFTRTIHVVGGVKQSDIADIRADGHEDADNQGLRRYALPLILTTLDPSTQVSHVEIPLADIPDNFDPDTELTWYVTMIANGLGRDYQEFAPLPSGNIGTGSQSMVLHQKSKGKGPGLFIKLISKALNDRGVIPRTTTFRITFADLADAQDAASLSKVRAEERKIRIDSGEIPPIIARQIATDDGDLDPQYLALMGEQDLTPDRVLEEMEKPTPIQTVAGVTGTVLAPDTPPDDEPPGPPDLDNPPEVKALLGVGRRLPFGGGRDAVYKVAIARIESRFRDATRPMARGAVDGVFSYGEFIGELQGAIERWFPLAYMSGLESCGVEDEITAEEEEFITGYMMTDLRAAVGFGEDVAEGKLSQAQALARVGTYGSRLRNLFAQGQAAGCGNKMHVWRLGKTEDHCADCLFYDGQVHRLSTWDLAGALPQSRTLECGGWHCDCRLVETKGKAVGRLRPPSNQGTGIPF